jgi:hypothetical protein
MGEAARKRRRVGQSIPGTAVDQFGKHVEMRYAGNLGVYITKTLRGVDQFDRTVPCGACTACCYHARVDVDPDEEAPENLEHLDLVSHPDGGLALRKRADGACVHLGSAGCTVYQYRPRACRVYDCRLYSAAGLGDSYDNDQRQPQWVFDVNSLRERAWILAIRLGAVKVVSQTSWTAAEAMRAGLAALNENFPIAWKILEQFDKLPKSMQEAFVKERFAKAAWLDRNTAARLRALIAPLQR